MARKFPPELARTVVDYLASGLGPNRVAAAAGVSRSYVRKVHHRLGGVYRPPNTNYSQRYLDREERYEIARRHDAGERIRAIAAAMSRSPSTVSRELRRNRDPRSSLYQPERAHRLAWDRQRRPKPSRLASRPKLRAACQRMLDRRFSPEQVAGRLRVDYPEDPEMQISHESIYQAIYVYPRGELRRELRASLRSGRKLRSRRGVRPRHSRIPNPVSIRERPEEVAGRLVPGHHEGDLVKGSTASNSAVATLVERTSGLLNLLHLGNGYGAEQVAAAVVERMSELPAVMAKTLTWDRGTEMARHETITATTQIQVYFADPYSPWQRGSNENINGLLREYLPKGSDLSVYSREDLKQIEDELNDRPRKRLGFLTPREVFTKLLEADLSASGVATAP